MKSQSKYTAAQMWSDVTGTEMCRTNNLDKQRVCSSSDVGSDVRMLPRH